MEVQNKRKSASSFFFFISSSLRLTMVDLSDLKMIASAVI